MCSVCIHPPFLNELVPTASLDERLKWSTSRVAACSTPGRMARILFLCYLTEAFPSLFYIIHVKLLKSFVGTPSPFLR